MDLLVACTRNSQNPSCAGEYRIRLRRRPFGPISIKSTRYLTRGQYSLVALLFIIVMYLVVVLIYKP